MPIQHGSSTPSTYRVGASAVDKLYLGATLLWQAATVAFENLSVFSSRVSGDGTATATYRVKADGTTSQSYYDSANTLTTNTVETWLLSGASSDYEIYVTHTGAGAGTFNAWLPLNVDRPYSVAALFGQQNEDVFTFQIRDIATQTVRDTWMVDITSAYGL